MPTHAKEAKLDAEDSLDVSTTQSALEDIDACQTEIDSLNEKASEEILTVEQKYNKLRRPHYSRRNDMIKKVPDFWYTVLSSHPQISTILSDDEEECLRSLQVVDVEEFEDIKSGYKLTFVFGKNLFFSNEKLVKEFHLATSGEPQSKSTTIEWKAGKDLTKKASEGQTNGRKRKMSSSETFFTWFMDNSDPNADELAEVIKDDIWPNPLRYYLASDSLNGQPDDEEDEEDYDEEEDEDDNDDDDDDGEEVDDSVVEIGDEESNDVGEEEVDEVEGDEEDDDDVQEVEGDEEGEDEEGGDDDDEDDE